MSIFYFINIPKHFIDFSMFPASIDLSHKSHNALNKYPTEHHFVTKMCTHVNISVTKCCIVGYGTDAFWYLRDGFIISYVGYTISTHKHTWWHHQMEPFSALLALYVGTFPQKGQWRVALMFSLICAWINDWTNNREAGDWRRHRGHYDVIVMMYKNPSPPQYPTVDCLNQGGKNQL